MTARGLLTKLGNAPLVVDGVRLDLVPRLAIDVLARVRASTESVASLNVGGWKSTQDLQAWPDESTRALVSTIRGLHLGGCRMIAWAMVNRSGSYHARHNHANAIVSGVYYVDAGDDANAAPTIFELGASFELDNKQPCVSTVEVAPVPGRLALFPGRMWHFVPPYLGDAPRVTIAFDVYD